MSQDKDVTPTRSTMHPKVSWIDRSLSLVSIQAYRRQSIRKMHGSVRRSLSRCGCGDLELGSLKQRRALIYGLLEPVEALREVLLTTECRMVPVLWILLIPDGGLFSWCEVVEVTDPEIIAACIEPSALGWVLTREVWETMGASEVRYKILQNTVSKTEQLLSRSRASVIREIMSANTSVSHINFSLYRMPANESESIRQGGFEFNEFDVEFLRTRYIPYWRHCGDMAYREFNTYTVTRKVD